ncbi:type II toxin-antitoxin system Phd/YefM family antitoxin [Rhodococcus aetherivorans]|uniref:type II toxin-antitoxin system Phd/YefM family antitoxin n=1 Tax=Rhodococcus aetherivorans TaxID=191292 RepID=UPI0002D2196D|nr:type II toxin-antitoxin system Phd/YefM family antitoxin [Rhodococcus aetherivorans]CCW11301.1 RelB/StbD replicon stabilization protein (antitoxin to RelE/StbE [Rhodococcus aetherivorans]
MHEVPLGEAEDKLSALVDSDEATHDIITITRHGKPAAVLMSVDDLESLQETIYWLSRPAPPSRSRPPTAILLSADSQGRILGTGSVAPSRFRPHHNRSLAGRARHRDLAC